MAHQLRRRPLMVSDAIERVLNRTMDRAAIGSLADLKRAYEAELAANYDEIAAQADRALANSHDTVQRIVGKAIREQRQCEQCGGPIEGGRRTSRWFCSDRLPPASASTAAEDGAMTTVTTHYPYKPPRQEARDGCAAIEGS